MTEPNFKDFDQILSDMMADLATKGTKLTDMNPGSVIRTLLEVAALKFDEGHYLAEQVINLYFVLTTTGEYLDRRVAERGLARKAGTKSTGIALASRSTAAPFGQLIPTGTTFETEDHTVQLVTTADATLDLGATNVNLTVEAVSNGKAGNLQTGTALKQVGVAISLIETVTVAAPGLAGGSDRESDNDLSNRYLTLIRSPSTSGNKADYQKWALEVVGVGGAQVIPLWNGPGTVKVVLIDSNMLSASPDIVAAVASHIEELRPVGAQVTVIAATSLEINVSATVVFDTDAYTLGQVQSEYSTRLTSYFADIAFEQNYVSFAQIGSILLGTPGVIDYSNLLVNNGSGNVTLNAEQIPVLGIVTLTP